MDNHTRGSAYFRQFFKRPLVPSCDCVACTTIMFAPTIIPIDAYEELHKNFAMTLPIPKPTSVVGIPDLCYMNFEEAAKHPLADDRQFSLQNCRRNNNAVVDGGVSLGEWEIRSSSETETQNVTQGNYIRGLALCNDCMKARCLYSIISPSRLKPLPVIGDADPTAEAIRLCREYAMQKFDEAQNSQYYACGMQPFDVDDLIYGVIVAREGLECHHHIQFEYYNNPNILTYLFNANLCACCAGASEATGVIDERVSLVWKIVLPICQQCHSSGALPIVRSRIRNGAGSEQRVQRPRLTTHASQAPGESYTTPFTMSLTTTPTPTRVTRRGRRAHEPNQDIVAPSARNTRRPSLRV